MSADYKWITELERLEIINQLERKNPPSKRYLGRSFNAKMQLEKFGRTEMKISLSFADTLKVFE